MKGHRFDAFERAPEALHTPFSGRARHSDEDDEHVTRVDTYPIKGKFF